MDTEITIGPLPALNRKAKERRFRRLAWKETDSFSYTETGHVWKFNYSSGMESELSDENKIATDWYEIDFEGVKFTIEEDVGIEEILFPGESICYLGIDNVRSWDRILTKKEIEAPYNNKKETKMEKEVAEVFTDLGKRTKYTGELYGPDGKGRGILAFDKKCDAKEVLAAPENLGCYIVLRKEVAIYTTCIPVVKVEGV